MIVCLGTTPTVQRTMTFDRLALDEVNRAKTVDEYASGKSVNVARVAHLLGADVLELGFVGGDRGEFLRRALTEEGVRHDFVSVGPRSRLCTTVIDSSTGTVTERCPSCIASRSGSPRASTTIGTPAPASRTHRA